MPELPEVESVRRQLEPALVGRRFEHVAHRRSAPRASLRAGRGGGRARRGARRGGRASRQVSGCSVRERSRSPDPPPDDGEPAARAGRFAPGRSASACCCQARRRIGRRLPRRPPLRHVAPARAGRGRAVSAARVGDEPLDALFTAARLGERLAGRRTSLKAALLDQRTLAGIGNIYVDEALWRARLNPLRPAAGLDRAELRRLHRGIRAALEHGLARQGSTLRDYRLPDGSGGTMQDEFRVYGRGGEPCDRCGTPIARTQVAGRTTWFCPACQPEEPAQAQAARSSSRRPSRSRRQSSA